MHATVNNQVATFKIGSQHTATQNTEVKENEPINR